MDTFERYSQYVEVLNSVCKEKSLLLNYKKINDGFRFHYITINDKDYDKTVVFSAGIHGDEIAGPYAVLKFLKDFVKVDAHVILFPIVNPHGFDNKVRHNAFRQDINRRFCDKLLAGEAKAVWEVLDKVKPDLFVSLHEWNDKDGYYMYCSDDIKKEVLLGIPKIAEKYFKVFTNRKINGEDVKEGIIWHPNKEYTDSRSRCTLENKVYVEGTHYICIETPSQAELKTRVKCQVEIMNYILEKVC